MTTASGIVSGAPLSSQIEDASAAASAALRLLQNRWPRPVELGDRTPAASMYHGYPYLFLDAFPALAPPRLEPLSLAATLFAASLFVADDIMDEDPTDRDTTTNVLRIQAMQFEGYQILHGLFAPGARFWDRFRGYLALYADACLTERRFVSPSQGWVELTPEVALGIARGKSSLAKFVVAGMAELAGDEAPLAPLLRALDHYYIARQMVDDLSDWRQDLAQGYPSLLLARVAATEFAGESKTELAHQPERTSHAIYFGGHARHILEIALRSLAEADELTAPFPDLAWHRVTARLRAHCRTMLAELDRIMGAEARPERDRRRLDLALPAPEGAWQETAWAALRSLLQAWRPHSAPAQRRSRQAAGGDALTRALAAGALCDADGLLGGQLRPLIEGEAGLLLQHRLRSGGWGWGTVSPGLPPDADHLGRILRLLVRLGMRKAVEDHCEPLLAILLERETPEGALPTWICREAGPPAGGPDEAVLAHLLASLDLYDRERFRPVVERGAAWIEARQRADGSWTSPGVHGHWLPTAACLELLSAVRPGSPAIARAAAFLRASQDGDGGWGHALDTALALLGLARVQPSAGEEEDLSRARRGRDSLLAPAQGGTLTSTFTLQAAIAWHRLETP